MDRDDDAIEPSSHSTGALLPRHEAHSAGGVVRLHDTGDPRDTSGDQFAHRNDFPAVTLRMLEHSDALVRKLIEAFRAHPTHCSVDIGRAEAADLDASATASPLARRLGRAGIAV